MNYENENSLLRANFAKYLAPLYNADMTKIADLCNEELDPTGKLLGYVREAARNSKSPMSYGAIEFDAIVQRGEKILTKPKTTDEILVSAATTFKERAPIYGKNWLKIGQSLMAMYPEGVTLKTVNDFVRFYYFVIKIVKLTRYANNFHKGGHQDSLHDDVVYGAMLESFDESIKS